VLSFPFPASARPCSALGISPCTYSLAYLASTVQASAQAASDRAASSDRRDRSEELTSSFECSEPESTRAALSLARKPLPPFGHLGLRAEQHLCSALPALSSASPVHRSPSSRFSLPCQVGSSLSSPVAVLIYVLPSVHCSPLSLLLCALLVS